MIVFTSLTKKFGDRLVLDQLSFRIDPGEFVCVTGPSGAGKSTVIHLLIRAEVPTEGSVEVDGVDLAQLPPSVLQLYRRRTGVVFQDYKLLSDRTVYENVAFAMEVCGDDDADIAKRVLEILRQMGLDQRMDAFPRELSGGEKARVALARALVHHPMIVIADEPTGNIDPKQSMIILKLLQEVHAQGTTVILASHDQQIIDALQTRVIRLENGKIIRDSVGGYESGSKQMTSIHEARKHKIFEKPKTVEIPKMDKSKTEKPKDVRDKEETQGSPPSKIDNESENPPKSPPDEPRSNRIKPIAI